MSRVMRMARGVFVCVLLGLAMAAPAGAEPGFEYGEVTRFGGFDRSAYNGGQYGGALTPGKFLDPTGFAVDPVDNTVYVVDRTSSHEVNPTVWRIQQFSPTGVLTGATMFTLPNSNAAASTIDGLAVDHRAGRVYALVVGSPPIGGSRSWPVAQELLAWSTTSVSDGLVAATAAGSEAQLPLDAVSSPVPGSPGTLGGVVSSATQLLSGPTPLYAPQGIAVDPLETSSVDNPVAIEASDLAPVEAGRPIPGDTIVQQVATQPQGVAIVGDLLSSWSGASVASQLGGSSWGPDGIATDPGGALTVMLETSGSSATSAYVVRLKADFHEATVLDNDSNVPPIGDFDQALLSGNESPFNRSPGVNISDVRGAGPQVVHLANAMPDLAGPYAAVIFSTLRGDSQVGVNLPEGSEYWTSGELPQEDFEANIGIRLLEPLGLEGAIADLNSRTILNTLGNGAESGSCKIGASNPALAVGAGGTLWILDRGPRTAQPNASGQGREVIELAPSAGQLCPQPFGTFKMTPAGGVSKTGEETLTVPAGTQVTFDTSSINRRHGKPFAYEWDIDGDPTNGPGKDGFEKVYEMTPPKYYYPPAKVTYMYTRPGEYKVRVRMRTDYGAYTPPHPGTVIVTPALTHPEARFTATPSGAQQVTFNATGSAPGVGTIVNYHWNWGDGSEEDEDPQTAVVSHTYAQPGEYQVKLTVTNSAYQSATSAPQTVTITAPARPASTPPVLTGPLYAIPPFTLYPIPPAPGHGSPTRLSPHVHFSGGALKVTLACPPAKALCAGTVTIETAAALAAQTGHKGQKKLKRKPSRLTLGRIAFSIPGGHSATVKVRLSAKGVALLKSRKRLKVLIVVSAHDSLGDPGTATLSMTLKTPAPRGGHVKR